MRVGFAKVELAPPDGLEMAGYVHRKSPAQGKSDPLEVFCLLFEDESEAVAVVVYDILGIPDGLKEELERETGIKVVPVATHTHSAPRPSLIAPLMSEKGKQAILKAQRGLSPARKASLLRACVRGVCSLRDREDDISLPATVLKFTTDSFEVGLLLFGCHPTVLGPDNLLYSADLAGAVRRKLGGTLSIDVIFLNSCCGNVSTHRTRRERTFKEVERLAELFCSQIRWEEQDVSLGRLRFLQSEIKLPLVEKKVDEKLLDERAKPGLELVRRRKIEPRLGRGTISALAAGDVLFMFFPFELFFETCERIREKVGKDVFLVCYANQYRPYVVPPDRKFTYEWVASPYPDCAENLLAKKAATLVSELYPAWES